MILYESLVSSVCCACAVEWKERKLLAENSGNGGEVDKGLAHEGKLVVDNKTVAFVANNWWRRFLLKGKLFGCIFLKFIIDDLLSFTLTFSINENFMIEN